MDSLHVYPNAPLVLTILELKHPQHDLTPPEAERVKHQLRDVLPLLETEQTPELALSQLVGGLPHGGVTGWHRFIARDRRTMLSCSSRSTVLETTNYLGWQEFISLFTRGLTARVDASGLEGMERVGLRYIDEVRIPTDQSASWDKWIRRELLPPIADIDGLSPVQQQSVVLYGAEVPGNTVTMRYGVTDGPSAVAGRLRPSPPPPGSFFLFDTDSAWTLPSDEPMPEVEIQRLVETAERLHVWSKSMFEWWPTTALRKEVFGAE